MPAPIAAARAAPLQTFEQLMRQHNRLLFRAARAILRDDAEAEDAVQEAWLRAYRSMDGFRGDAKLSSWLVRIVVNEALGRLRKRARRAEVVPLRGGAGEGEREGEEQRSEHGGGGSHAAKAPHKGPLNFRSTVVT